MGAERHHATLNRADLLWCFSMVSVNQYADIATLLGFEALPEPIEAADKQLEMPEEPREYLRPPKQIDISTPPKPLIQGNKAAYYRVKDRQPVATTPSPTTEALSLPDWFTQAKPTFLEETATRIPALHRKPPEFPPLIPWSRLWPFLQRVLGAEVPGQQPDLKKIVRQVAQGEQLRQIPKRTRHTWAPLARVLIDINDSNFPYRQDFLRLKQQLAAWRGEEGLAIEFIVDEPGGMVARYQDGREIIVPWRSPQKEVPLLILSDFGIHSGSRRQLYQWLAFGQQLNIQGIRPTVLMPVAERDVHTQLLRYFNCICWDDLSRLRPVQGEDNPETISHAQQVEQLLALHFAAMRVDLGLLRSLRRLQGHYDVGHEAAVWQHTAVNCAGDEWGWQANSRINYLPAFLKLFNQLPLAKQQQLVELIGRHHAQLPDELYFEAMDELLRLQLPVPEVIPQVVKAATEAFTATLVKTYAERPENQGLGLWVKRYLMRHDDPAMRNNSDRQIAFLAFEKLRSHQGDTATLEWPKDIDPEKLLPFINSQQAQQVYLLRQKGSALELLPEAVALEQADDWGDQSVTILRLALTDTTIFHRYTAEDGSQKLLSLNLENGKYPLIKFPVGSQHQLQIGAEILTIEALPSGDIPDWAIRRGMSGHTTFLDTRSNEGKEHRWYWHPPSIGQQLLETEQDIQFTSPKRTICFPGFWYYQQPDKDLKPDWAYTADRDHFGLFVDVNIVGVVQRFRWIEPGSFEMDSPQEEKGRYPNETLHKVILTRGFWLADTACTQALWKVVMLNNPSKFKGDNRPVENVSWNDVQEFLLQLNPQHPELSLRLPTETEWENACRAGAEITSTFNFEGELSQANVNYRGTWDSYEKWGENALKQTVAVKQYSANAWGLHEMHGNVFEWCQDCHGLYPSGTVTDPLEATTSSYHVVRGGSWSSLGWNCRSAARNFYEPDYRNDFIGFRLARSHEFSLASSGIKQTTEEVIDATYKRVAAALSVIDKSKFENNPLDILRRNAKRRKTIKNNKPKFKK